MLLAVLTSYNDHLNFQITERLCDENPSFTQNKFIAACPPPPHLASLLVLSTV